MELAYTIGLLVLGFAILLKAADWFVDGASSLAKKMGVSEIMIGLTVVAFGTSAPELFVNIMASIKPDSASGITFGNIVGSNICNILLILGLAAVIRPIYSEFNTVWKEIPYAILSAVMLLVLTNDWVFGGAFNILDRKDGIILLVCFAGFLFYVIRLAKKSDASVDNEPVQPLSKLRTCIYLILGLAGMVIGAELTVDNAVKIAKTFNVSDKLIGLTIIAIGTSLPELATSVVAACKGKNAIAMGNIVGSNIFNIFLILGITLCIKPIQFYEGGTNTLNIITLFGANVDLIVLVVASFLLFLTMFTGKKSVLDRWEAGIFLASYVGYITYLMWQK